MNDDRLQRFQTGTLIALVFYLGLLLYMAVIGIPTSNPMWNKGLAQSQIRDATTMQDLQTDLRSAVGNLTWGLHLKNQLLLIFLISTFFMVIYLGWSLWTIHRLKKTEE